LTAGLINNNDQRPPGSGLGIYPVCVVNRAVTVGAPADQSRSERPQEDSMTETLDHVSAVLADAVVEDREAGVYRANRRIFTDEEIFELEMKHIFEGNWIYLAHESQVPNPGDYFTTYIGRQPVVITRDKQGQLHCLINACAHRGAML